MFLSHQTSVSALPGETEQAKYYILVNAASLCDSNNVHLAHFVQISSTLADSLCNCPVVQLLTVNIRNIGHLYKHRHAYALSIH